MYALLSSIYFIFTVCIPWPPSFNDLDFKYEILFHDNLHLFAHTAPFPWSYAESLTTPPLSFADHLHLLCSVQIKVARWWRPLEPPRSRGPQSLICRNLSAFVCCTSPFALVLPEKYNELCLDHIHHTVSGEEMRVRIQQHFLSSEWLALVMITLMLHNTRQCFQTCINNSFPTVLWVTGRPHEARSVLAHIKSC